MSKPDEHPERPPATIPIVQAGSERKRVGAALPPQIWIVVILLVVGVALRFHQLDAKGLWGDEIWTAQWSQGPLNEVWSNLTLVPDIMPLTYVLVGISTRFGSSEFWVRLPAALFGVAGLLIFYLLANRVLGRRTALVSAVLIALSPIHIWYSQDARYYTQLCALGVASVYFFYTFLTADRFRLASWLGYLISTIAALYTHLFAGWIVIAQAFFAVYYFFEWTLGSNDTAYRRRLYARNQATWLAAALLLLVVFMLPVIVRLIETLQTGTSQTGEGMATLRLAPALPDYLTGAFLVSMVQNFSGGRLATFVMLPLFVVGLVSTWRTKRDVAVLVLCLITAPFLTTFFLDLLHGVSFKYFFYLLPFYLLLVAQGLVTAATGINHAIGRRRERNSADDGQRTIRPHQTELALLSLILLAIVVILVQPMALVYRQAKINDWRTIAGFLAREVQPEDVVLVERWGGAALRYYLPPASSLTILDLNANRWQRARSLGARIWIIGLDDEYEPLAQATLQQIDPFEWQDTRWVYERGAASPISFPINEVPAKIFVGEGTTATSMYDFDDVINAGWTEVTYREVVPGRQTAVRLSLDPTAPRLLSLRYFDSPGKDLEVLVDGRTVGTIRGGENGRWQTWTHELPWAAGDSVLVVIAATGADVAGLDWVELTYAHTTEADSR